jgi:lipoyl(octanoyl) transferase
VLYLLIDLRRRGLGVRRLVDLIEQSLVATLAQFGIEGEADPKAPGVYVGGAKIAALGLRVRRGCSYHGLSLNVAMDLEPFARINPCGYAGLTVTSMQALLGGACPQMDEVGRVLVDSVLGRLEGGVQA